MYVCIGDSLLDREGARSSGSALAKMPSSPKALEFFYAIILHLAVPDRPM